MSNDNDHAVLAPSAAGAWGRCSGMVAANSRCREKPESDAMRAGTAGHELGYECIRSGVPAYEYIGTCSNNGVPVDQEMADAVQVYVDEVNKLKGYELILEQRLFMPQIHDQNWGTIDCAAYDRANRTVHAVEYKHGRRFVDEVENFQLIDYSVGLINHWQITEPVEFVFKVVQPRCFSSRGSVREWRINSVDLSPYYEQLKQKAHEALGPSPTLTTGKHCINCDAVGHCAAARKAGYNAVDYVDHTFEVDEMSDHDVGLEYELVSQWMSVLKSRKEALADELEFRIEQGSRSTGYTYESTAGKWEWNVSIEDVVQFAKLFDIDARRESTMTVAQVKSAIPAKQRKQFEAMRSLYAKQKSGSKKLTAVKDSLAARVFGGGN